MRVQYDRDTGFTAEDFGTAFEGPWYEVPEGLMQEYFAAQKRVAELSREICAVRVSWEERQ